MLWRGGRESDNVEDRRGIGGGGLVAGGGIGALVIGLIYMLLGGDPSTLQTGNQSQQALNGGQHTERSAAENEQAAFTKVVLGYTEDVWDSLFKAKGQTYRLPSLVMFNDATQSGCGFASEASGPFYCPSDEKVYIDLSFFNELQDRFHVAGNFASAYVIAHEVGHHIQKLMGTMDAVDRERGRRDEKETNRLSVKLELQADFLAGVWAHYAQWREIDGQPILQSGDIESALTAANAIGDDRLQKQSKGYVVPDAFTHGTSAQRMYWFKKGYETGDIRQGDTFNATNL
jgi:predicted metalloprotease